MDSIHELDRLRKKWMKLEDELQNDLNQGISEEEFLVKDQICQAVHKEWQNFLFKHKKDIFLKVENEK
ncbi:hypothetical protein Lnau_2138 [Legionella nautarum]|uniref:Coiled-coil protein n=1 Tax=Legionella nautarum TaxID=45070 RepID=A0A0W0WP03_9GAMM|nr:hypothetical protein [Legionella nautarum]KTD33846.1 hypothetical protein Lnau_2138 [Legionella nautarum]